MVPFFINFFNTKNYKWSRKNLFTMSAASAEAYFLANERIG